MPTLINTTIDEPRGNWRTLGVVMGVAVTEYQYAVSGADNDHIERTRAARESALERMNVRAAQKGADAVVGIRFDSSVVNSTHSMVEYTAYGTAIKRR